jgi:hypothetical protein
MERANIRYVEKVRWDHFTALSTAWQEGRRHREFLIAAKSVSRDLDASMREQVLEELQVIERLMQDFMRSRTQSCWCQMFPTQNRMICSRS